MKSSLPSKIALTMWVMSAVSTIASALLAGSLLVGSHRQSVRQQLQAAATGLISLGISNFSELKDFEKLNQFIEEALQMERVDKIVRIYGPTKRLAFTTVGVDYDQLPNLLEISVEKPVFVTVRGKQHVYETLILPYTDEERLRRFYLQIAIPLPPYLEIVESLWWQVILLFGLLIGLSLALSRSLSGRLLKPVGRIASHLKELDPNKIEEWRSFALDKKGGYLEAISEGINSLTNRTREAVIRLRKMSRYVAHEMRTPLTIVRGEAETALAKKEATKEEYQRVLKSSLEEVQRMSEIVDIVLQAAETRRPEPPPPTTSLDLGRWLLQNKPQWEKTLGGPLTLNLPQLLPSTDVSTEPGLLFRLIDNLVRNVRDHAPVGTGCHLSLGNNSKGVKLTLEDQGPGLPPPLLDRLNSGDPDATAGIGLDLCRRIAEICNLGLRFSNREKGGLCVEINLPGG